MIVFDPDNPTVLAMLSNASLNNYMLFLRPNTITLEKAERLLQKAIALDPECQLAHITEAFLRYIQGRADQCIAKIELLKSLNLFNTYIIHCSGIYLYLLGHFEEGMRLCNQVSITTQVATRI